MGRLDAHHRISFAPRRLHELVLGPARVALAREEGLVVLGAQVHVVVRERLLVRGPVEALVLGTAEQVERVAPHLALGNRVAVRSVAQPIASARGPVAGRR